MTAISRSDLVELCAAALGRVGAAPNDAQVLATATVEAELVGNRAVGVAHLFDYLDGYYKGRIAIDADPVVHRAAPAVIDVDACGGLAQTAFVAAFDQLEQAAVDNGIAALWIKNTFTCGELGYYARHLAQRGIIAVAAANSPALMSVGGATKPILGTNPLAYGIPRPGQLPFVIDQATSSTAFVNIRRAADAGEPIPAGWAVGSDGNETVDAQSALTGALLPFGGYRGGNIALLVEMLATLSGAFFSLDASPFDKGSLTPGIGVFLLGIAPTLFPGSIERLDRQLVTLRGEHGVHLPALELTTWPATLDIPQDALERLQKVLE